MKIIIFTTFGYWEQDHLWVARSAYEELKEKYNTVEYLQLPFKNDNNLYLEQVLAFRSLDFSSADLVLTFGPFAHTILHRNKICFLIQHLKEFYELWDSPYGELNRTVSSLIKKRIHNIDFTSLAEAKKIFCFYEKINNRYSGLKINVLPHPKLYPVKGIDSNKLESDTLLSLGTFCKNYRFEVLINGLNNCEMNDFKLVIAAKLRSKEVYESLQRVGKLWIQRGHLELIVNPSEQVEDELIAKSFLIIDASTENDCLSRGLLRAIEWKKPIIGLPGSGFLESSGFRLKEFSLDDLSPQDLGGLMEYARLNKIKIQNDFLNQLSKYSSVNKFNWGNLIL